MRFINFPLTPTTYSRGEFTELLINPETSEMIDVTWPPLALLFGKTETHWRFVIKEGSNFAIIGKQYATKDQLMFDIDNVALSYTDTWNQ